MGASCVALLASLAGAQTPDPLPSADRGPMASTTYASAFAPGLQVSEAQALEEIVPAARSGQAYRIRQLMPYLSGPIARDIGLWALVESGAPDLTFSEADTALKDLGGFPGQEKREIAAENIIDQARLAPAQVIAWFGGRAPVTARGAMALADALRASGRIGESAELIENVWRTMPFDQASQDTMLARFGGVITQADDIAREDMLLYGPQGSAAEDMLRLLPPDQQALAQARMALRRGSSDAETLVASLPPALQASPGIAYERALRYRDEGQPTSALTLINLLPQSIPGPSAADKLWRHGFLVVTALEAGNPEWAYAAATHSGLTQGPGAAEAQFFAGWIALTRLHDPKLADSHFAQLITLGRSPITLGRAWYWRGRAAEAMGDPVAAQYYFGQGAHYITTFYGQLCAAKAGMTELTLPRDPVITAADSSRFQSYAAVQAARMMAELNEKAEFNAFLVSLAESFTLPADEAQLVDLARTFGDQSGAMRVVRDAAQRGIVLAERGYPLLTPPAVGGGPETPFVLGIVRQESSFDPAARSGAGAVGMMQLMPTTAEVEARRLGLPYSSYELTDASYNMELGSAFLGHLVAEFSGSYVMAAAAYNAGPGRPAQWAAACGDPRGPHADPTDFIECIPFSETRDYVMRVLEATQVYRARLAGGSAPLTLAEDLRRGGFAYASLAPAVPTVASAPAPVPARTTISMIASAPTR